MSREDVVRYLPYAIASSVTKYAAGEIAKRLRGVGAEVEIK